MDAQHPDAEQSLKAWYHDAKQAAWTAPNDIRQIFATASILANNRVVFNIRGNHYRLGILSIIAGALGDRPAKVW